jgi:hypothetical protein
MTSFTVQQSAKLEGVSARAVQRYCKDGFQGKILRAVKLGRSLQIAEQEYKLWRVACGFAPGSSEEPHPVPSAPDAVRIEVSQDEAPAPCAALFPPWPQCADPNGVPTNVPDPHSCTMPHPLAVEAHRAQQLREQQIRYRGYADDDNE